MFVAVASQAEVGVPPVERPSLGFARPVNSAWLLADLGEGRQGPATGRLLLESLPPIIPLLIGVSGTAGPGPLPLVNCMFRAYLGRTQIWGGGPRHRRVRVRACRSLRLPPKEDRGNLRMNSVSVVLASVYRGVSDQAAPR